MGKNGVEVIEYGGQVWINQKNLEKKKLGTAHISDKTQYYSSEFKNRSVEAINLVEYLLKIL